MCIWVHNFFFFNIVLHYFFLWIIEFLCPPYTLQCNVNFTLCTRAQNLTQNVKGRIRDRNLRWCFTCHLNPSPTH